MELDHQNSMKCCQNCSQPFPQQKIDLHQAYCRRNIKKCPQCNQLYDINDQEGHQKQFHTKKQCRYCYLLFPQKSLDDHHPSCKKRPVKCKFCQNDIAYEQVLKHQQTCGSRTVKCDICMKFIALRQIDVHKLTCVQRISPIRRQQIPRMNSRDQLRQNIREGLIPLQRIKSQNQKRYEWLPPRQEINRNQIPSYEDPSRRNDRISNQRINVVSNERKKVPVQKKLPITLNTQLKPSHIIEPQRIRQYIDPVPISIRLAMRKSPRKVPLQNKN